MRFIVLVKGNADSEEDQLPPKEMIEEMETFNERLERDGILRYAEGLRPTKAGARIEFGGKTPVVSRGPFNTGELIAGYWVIETKSLDAAIDAMTQAPFPGGQIEIRQLHEDEDFSFAPELVAREKALRAKLEQRRPS